MVGSRKEGNMSIAKNKHLTMDERRIIEVGIGNGSTHTAIAATIGKDKSTIGREIREHRYCKVPCSLIVECAIYSTCKPGHYCKGRTCKDFIQFTCNRRDRSPGACNGCEKFSKCHYDKMIYSAVRAQKEYEEKRSDSRQGPDLTTEEAKKIAGIVKPLLFKGQSPYHILMSHPELSISEKTLYTYIEDGVLSRFGISAIDLRRQVSRKLPKKARDQYKKRNDYRYLQGRKYEDYLSYLSDNPDVPVVQMDTVYNDETNGPFLQTFKFVRYGLLFALYHTSKTGEDMLKGIDLLEKILSPALFQKHRHILLTDRGTEFTLADRFETSSDGSRRTRVFYCDPMASGQKGSLENKHRELRYILPKEADLCELGLTSQDKLNLALSHINSAPLQALEGRSAFEMIKFLSPELYQQFISYGLSEIEKDAVTLTPRLLK